MGILYVNISRDKYFTLMYSNLCEQWKVLAAVAAYAISISFFNVPDTWQMHSRITALGKFISFSMTKKDKGIFKSEKHQVLKAWGCCGTGEQVSNSVKCANIGFLW